ncbi:hypothetical protein V0R50_26505 [Pseudomonas sp. 148P]|uniref:Lipoprotein n=1 Tax=Pseudomonas ulcerans TaxID=3115852 RepID=A0ABU7HYZ6_9PSED|nr:MULTISPECIES: hypothetical protein [unclassified Pseudomonas]MEE1925336.1 hypothetical protein [Pseudomonas sp. 147P]MEE1936790.1 hypothetical protein [Pseudomonas sp. 148P]
MPRIATLSLLAALVAQPAFAWESFECAGAVVDFSIDTSLRSTEGADVILRVDNGSRSTVLRYGSIDYVGATCDTDSENRPRIVYQAICAGSGCFDLSNWGVIDPDSLRVLLVPADDSLEKATVLLGHRPTLDGEKLSVSKEAHRLGLPTP